MTWISVDQKLPPDNEDVLIYNPRDGISIGYFESESVSWYIESDGSKCYTDSGWSDKNPWAPDNPPKHWMPLPEIPV